MKAELDHVIEQAFECKERDRALNLAEAIRLRFEPFGGIDLESPPPVPVGEPVQFDW